MFFKYNLYIASLALLGGLCCLSSISVSAQCPTNNPSDLPNITKQAVESASKTKIIQNTQVEEEKQKKAVNGNANCSASPNNTKGKNEIKTTAYDYLKEKILKGEQLDIIKPQKDYESAVKEVKKIFFTEKEEKASSLTSGIVGMGITAVTGMSTENMNDVLQKRMDYVTEISASSLEHAIALREKVKEDIQSVAKVQTKGCNQLQGYQLQNRNLQALIKATAADIIVQILIMESTASQNLLKEPPNLIELSDEPDITKESTSSSTSLGETVSFVRDTLQSASAVAGIATGNLNMQDIQTIKEKTGGL